MEDMIKVFIKWNEKEYKIELTQTNTIKDLKDFIEKQTGIPSSHQKLLNLKFKDTVTDDECTVCQLELKTGFKIVMVAPGEAYVKMIAAPKNSPVMNTLNNDEDKELAFENNPYYLARIEELVKYYKIDILNQPRAGKKLLVLDIDYTIFDQKKNTPNKFGFIRPYLHKFLTSAYKNYDIVFWSATDMRWIKKKLDALGISNNPNYKIMFHLDYSAMISVYGPEYDVYEVKPLGVIWGKINQYSKKNTIMLDDLSKNFLMNPKNGLTIRPFGVEYSNITSDKELYYLSEYLEYLVKDCDDFSEVDHGNWKAFNCK